MGRHDVKYPTVVKVERKSRGLWRDEEEHSALRSLWAFPSGVAPNRRTVAHCTFAAHGECSNEILLHIRDTLVYSTMKTDDNGGRWREMEHVIVLFLATCFGTLGSEAGVLRSKSTQFQNPL